MPRAENESDGEGKDEGKEADVRTCGYTGLARREEGKAGDEGDGGVSALVLDFCEYGTSDAMTSIKQASPTFESRI